MKDNTIVLTRQQVAMLVGIALANPDASEFTVTSTSSSGIGISTQVLAGEATYDITDLDCW